MWFDISLVSEKRCAKKKWWYVGKKDQINYGRIRAQKEGRGINNIKNMEKGRRKDGWPPPDYSGEPLWSEDSPGFYSIYNYVKLLQEQSLIILTFSFIY